MFRKLVASLVLASVAASVAVPAAAAQPNIVGRLIQLDRATGRFDTLIAAAVCTPGVIDALDGPEARTLFAPTDAAFAEAGLNETNICSANLAPYGGLFNVLAYHVLDARVPFRAAAEASGDSVVMLNGQAAQIEGSRPNVTIDGARIVQRNMPASNGLIHVIGSVMLPVAAV